MKMFLLVMLKVIGTIFKAILIVPIYTKIVLKYRTNNTRAIEQGDKKNWEIAKNILKEQKFDLAKEMWIDFKLLCKGVWRTRITKNPLWMIGTVVVLYYTLKLTWGLIVDYKEPIIWSTLASFAVWGLYKYFEDHPIVIDVVNWSKDTLAKWEEVGSEWVFSIVEDQERFEKEQRIVNPTGTPIPEKEGE